MNYVDQIVAGYIIGIMVIAYGWHVYEAETGEEVEGIFAILVLLWPFTIVIFVIVWAVVFLSRVADFFVLPLVRRLRWKMAKKGDNDKGRRNHTR